MNGRIMVFVALVLLLTACGIGSVVGGGGSDIVGKWRAPDDIRGTLDCTKPLRGFAQIEFFSDQTVTNYNIIGDNESTGMSGNYTFPDSKRIKIEWQGGRFTDILGYSVSGSTLTLCEGNSCCSLQSQ